MDLLTTYLGHFGCCQFTVFTMAALFQLPMAMQIFSLIFFAPNVDFWCTIPDGLDIDVMTWRQLSNPTKEFYGMIVPDGCLVYDGVFETVRNHSQLMKAKNNTEKQMTDWNQVLIQKLNSTIIRTKDAKMTKCHSWEYDSRMFPGSMTEQFNLVCDKHILISTSNALSMVGVFLGTLSFGHLSDKFGRRKIALICLVLATIVNISMIFCQDFLPFMILRVFQQLFNIGALQPLFILVAEIFSEKYRASLGNLFWLGYSFGVALFAATAYGLRSWQKMQVTVAVPYIAFSIILWFFPESPRWLMSKGRTKEAAVQIKRMAKWNRKLVPQTDVIMAALEKDHTEKYKNEKTDRHYSIVDLFRWSHLRWKTPILFFSTAVNSFIYYGLTFNIGQLAGDPFLNCALLGIVEIPGVLLAAIIAQYMGRKYPLSIGMLLSGISFVISGFSPNHIAGLQLAFSLLTKFFISSTFSLVLIFVAELYPTVIRNITMGSMSFVSAIASIIAPYIKELGTVSHPYVPVAIIGCLTIISGLLILLLPETKGVQIPDTIEDAAKLHRKKKKSDKEADKELKLEVYD